MIAQAVMDGQSPLASNFINDNGEWPPAAPLKNPNRKISVPPWIVKAAGGGLPAIIAAQAWYWFPNCKPQPQGLVGQVWLTTYRHLGEQVGAATDAKGHMRVRRALDSVVAHGLARVLQGKRILKLQEWRHTCTSDSGCVLCVLASTPAQSWLAIEKTTDFEPPTAARKGVNAVPPDAVRIYGPNEAILLTRLEYRQRKEARGWPFVDTYDSLSRTTGLSPQQIRDAAANLSKRGCVRRDLVESRRQVWSSRWMVDPSVFAAVDVPPSNKAAPPLKYTAVH